jgi:hypothetical protein
MQVWDVDDEIIDFAVPINASDVMVWVAVSKKRCLPLVLIDTKVKINAKYYKEEVLKKHLLSEQPEFVSRRLFLLSAR